MDINKLYITLFMCMCFLFSMGGIIFFVFIFEFNLNDSLWYILAIIFFVIAGGCLLLSISNVYRDVYNSKR